MRLHNVGIEKLREYTENLQHYVVESFSQTKTLYIDLGVKTVRLLIYSPEFIPHIEKQLEYVLREDAESYDATIILWKEPNIKYLYRKILPEFDPAINLKLRIEYLSKTKPKLEESELYIFEDSFSKINPVLQIFFGNNIITHTDFENNTYYYGVENLDPEVFIREGHIFVQQINKILKSENTNLAHGAVIGFDNKGALICARGQRGKSTLAVLSMIRGFDYVSDDYMTLEKTDKGLFPTQFIRLLRFLPECIINCMMI